LVTRWGGETENPEVLEQFDRMRNAL
jgi:hypothetical protein